MSDAPGPKLDYQAPRPRPPRFRWPPDWRRRLKVVAVAAPLVFLLTFEAARHSQARAIAYKSGGIVNFYILNMQREVDAHTRTTGHPPAMLTDVPAIQSRAEKDPTLLTDPWRNPYMLQTTGGKPTVISYARDGAPGGKGLDADITSSTPYGSQLPTYSQFIQITDLFPVLFICFANAALVAILPFTGTITDTRQEPRGLAKLILTTTLTAIISVVVAGFIAMLHAPSGH